MRIYIGNLNYEMTEDELRDSFAEHGEVSSVVIIKDRETGASRGFGFVEMSSDEEGMAAIEALNGSNVGGRTLTVNVARPREDRRDSRGGGRRGFDNRRDQGPRRW